jgi:predicted Fe-Mo cluster-binding NifX family protein
MKIAITSFGPNLTSRLCPRFGSCAYFLVIDPEKIDFEVFDNKDESSTGCNGSTAARFLVSKKVHAVITGRCRPETFQILSDAGVYLYLNQSGTVKEVLGNYHIGRLRRATPALHSNSTSSAVASY